MKIITKKMIEDGLMANVIIPKLESDGLKAYIGDNWFYFGGLEFEWIDPQDITFTTKVEEIFIALYSIDYNDYVYYYNYLLQHI